MQGVKKGVAISPVVIDNATATAYVIDTAGVDFVNIDVIIGATDIGVTTLKVQESDVASNSTTLTSPTDVPGLIFGTSVDPDTNATSVLPSATDDNKVFTFFVNTQARKRYLQLLAVAGNGTVGVAIAANWNGGKVSNFANTAQSRGVASNLIA